MMKENIAFKFLNDKGKDESKGSTLLESLKDLKDYILKVEVKSAVVSDDGKFLFIISKTLQEKLEFIIINEDLFSLTINSNSFKIINKLNPSLEELYSLFELGDEMISLYSFESALSDHRMDNFKFSFLDSYVYSIGERSDILKSIQNPLSDMFK